MKTHHQFVLNFSFLIILGLSACSSFSNGQTTETPIMPNVEITEPYDVTSTQGAALTSTSEPTTEIGYPYYLPLVTEPDVAPQTIKGVTVAIDWAYADESRVAVSYSIKGLDLPDGFMLDGSTVSFYSNAVPNIGYGGGSWGNQPMDNGVITGTIEQFFVYGDLNANEHPSIDLTLEIPIDKSGAIFPPPTEVTTPQPPAISPAPEIGTFRFRFDIPVLRGITLENLDQTVTTNNVSMTLKTLVLNPSYVQALICFQMPSPKDWGLSASTINIDGKDFPLVGFGLLPNTSGKDFTLNDPERCVSTGFDTPYNESLSSVTISVPKLVASTPEVISQERVAEANKQLADIGIEFEYKVLDHGSNIIILKRPEGATDPEIYPLIWDALADQYEGPWVFTVNLK